MLTYPSVDQVDWHQFLGFFKAYRTLELAEYNKRAGFDPREVATERAAAERAVFRAVVTGCGKLYRARSRLYRNEILQVNMRLKALAEIYTMHSFALLQNHIFLKIC